MARAVINLLRNAIRHAHSRVEIALLDQGDSCQIRVNDDGPGIPADARQKIFEPFRAWTTAAIAAPAASAWAWRSSAGSRNGTAAMRKRWKRRREAPPSA